MQNISEKRQEGFYRGKRVGRRVDSRSRLKAGMDLICSGVGLI